MEKTNDASKGWIDGWVDGSNGNTCFCKVDQPGGCWDDSMDLHHHWGDHCPSSIDSSSDPLLQLHWNRYYDGIQKREES